MLLPNLAALSQRRIILASTSPRRREILSLMGLSYEVIGSQFEENLDKTHFQQPYEYAVKNATCKALEVYHRLYKEQPNTRPVLIIGADTIVVNQQTILEKPRSKEQAIHMISQLQGKQHATYTGIAFVYDGSNGPETHSFYEATTVVFAPMDERTIEAYVSTGEPMDKAGAYGIQGFASCFISGIQGDYYNVVGLPLHRIYTELSQLVQQGRLDIKTPKS